MSALRGRLVAYARWQLRDYFAAPGIATMFVAFIFFVPMIIGKNEGLREGASPADMQRVMSAGFDVLLALLATLGPIIGAGSIAAADRHPGLSRFLFSKPISVRAYYAQAWIIRGLALGAISAAQTLIVIRYFASVSFTGALATIGMAWLLIGGMGMLLSVLMRRDLVAIFALYTIPTLLESMVKGGLTWWWLKPSLAVLPPTHKLDEFRRAMMTDATVATGDAWHMALYGAVCLAVAIYLARRMSLVR